MATFCVDKDVLDLPKHIVFDDGRAAFVDDPPDETYLYDGVCRRDADHPCLDTLFALEHAEVSTRPPDAQVRCARQLFGEDEHVPWSKIMRPHDYRSYVKITINAIAESIDKVSKEYFEGTWVPCDGLYDRLQPAKIDRHVWLQHIRRETSQNESIIESFEPDASGWAQPVVYDRMRTRTGRLSVKSGPRILTLKKECRNVLVSRYGANGKIAYIDFAALEARIILHESGRWFNAVDLYSKLANDVFGGKFSRQVVKGAVISELYGVSNARLAQTLGIPCSDVEQFVDVIRTYFDIDRLRKKICDEYASTGWVRNHYGRRICIDDPSSHVLVNSYVQSTGVDVSTLGFLALLRRYDIVAPSVVPLYVLHDALIVDVKNCDWSALNAVNSVTVPGYVQRFFVTIQQIT